MLAAHARASHRKQEERDTDHTYPAGAAALARNRRLLRDHDLAARRGPRVLQAARALAKQSGIPMRNLTLVNRQRTYAHNDPAGAFPANVFFKHLLPFLETVARG